MIDGILACAVIAGLTSWHSYAEKARGTKPESLPAKDLLWRSVGEGVPGGRAGQQWAARSIEGSHVRRGLIASQTRKQASESLEPRARDG